MRFYIFFFFLFLALGCGSPEEKKQETKIEKKVIVPETPKAPEEKPKKVRIMFALQANFPAGAVQPTKVLMDNQVVQEGSEIWTGNHNFIIEKNGYKTIDMETKVDDGDNDSIFRLSAILEAKERIVHFKITDKYSGLPVEPDQVIVSPLVQKDEQSVVQPKSISDNAYLNPGMKKIVIQKEGYQNISRDITIDPDEKPYELECQMEPLS